MYCEQLDRLPVYSSFLFCVYLLSLFWVCLFNWSSMWVFCFTRTMHIFRSFGSAAQPSTLDLGPSFCTVREITACTVNFSQGRSLLGLFQQEELCAFQLLHPWDLSAHGLVLPCMPFLAHCISKSLPCKLLYPLVSFLDCAHP